MSPLLNTFFRIHNRRSDISYVPFGVQNHFENGDSGLEGGGFEDVDAGKQNSLWK